MVVELLTFRLVEAVSVVKAPVEADELPIAVELRDVAVRVVNVPAAALAPPITAPSTVPPLISTVVTVPKFDHVPVKEPPLLAVSVPPTVSVPLISVVVAFTSSVPVSYTHLTLPTIYSV